jgi:GxxExxY protein
VTENELSRLVVDSAYQIHSTLGPGLFESVYETTLAYELCERGCRVVCQRGVPLIYKDVKLELGFRADIIVNGKLIVEVKSIEAIGKVHGKQLLTYLRLTDMRLGLLINFNVDLIKDGIKRVVNNLNEQ